MSCGTIFHTWRHSKLASLRREFLTESLSSSMWTLQSAMNQQVEALQSLRCMSKMAIYTVTWSCSTSKLVPPGHGHNQVTVQIAVSNCSKGGEASLLADSYLIVLYCVIEEFELLASLALILNNSLLCHIWKLVLPEVMHVIRFTRLPLFFCATSKYWGVRPCLPGLIPNTQGNICDKASSRHGLAGLYHGENYCWHRR